MKANFYITLLFLAFLCITLPASAQSYSIDWFTIASGGDTSTGGVFALTGTIGQPDATEQPMSDGDFALSGGFWSILAVQTPEAPPLTIRMSGANTAMVSWPSPSTGFFLQESSSTELPNWTAVSEPITDDGINKFITVTPPAGNRFYRLAAADSAFNRISISQPVLNCVAR